MRHRNANRFVVFENRGLMKACKDRQTIKRWEGLETTQV